MFTDTFAVDTTSRPEHISLSEWAEVFCIAPATADIVAKIAAGFADNLLLLTLVACASPVLVAPSMNDRMWANPIVRRNLETLRGVGYRVLEAESGHLACGSTGPGRLPEPADLLREIDLLLEPR